MVIKMRKIWENNSKLILIVTIAIVLASGVTYAATTMYDSNIVGYDNTTSGLNSNNVQDALDEVYSAATDYTELNENITSLSERVATLNAYNDTEKEVGTYNGSVLYIKIVSGYKTTTAWGVVADTGLASLDKIKKYEAFCLSFDGYNLDIPYYKDNSDMFRAALAQSGSTVKVYVQLGTTYPSHSSPGAFIWVIIYYVK